MPQKILGSGAKPQQRLINPRILLKSQILKLWVPVPPLAEQRRIVADLDGLQAKVDGLKALQEKTATELDALLPAILDKAFKGEL